MANETLAYYDKYHPALSPDQLREDGVQSPEITLRSHREFGNLSKEGQKTLVDYYRSALSALSFYSGVYRGSLSGKEALEQVTDSHERCIVQDIPPSLINAANICAMSLALLNQK